MSRTDEAREAIARELLGFARWYHVNMLFSPLKKEVLKRNLELYSNKILKLKDASGKPYFPEFGKDLIDMVKEVDEAHTWALNKQRKYFEWMDKARMYIHKHKKLNMHNKLFLLGCYQDTNMNTFVKDIDDGETPEQSVETNIDAGSR